MQIQKATLSDLDNIKRLADANKETLGFVLRATLEASIQKQWLLISTTENSLAGFVNYRHCSRISQTTIYEICVTQSFREQGIGHALILAVQEESKMLARATISLKTPVGIPANDFYRHIGFLRTGVQSGRKCNLNIWTLSN